jgi:TonB family protein
MLNSVDVTYRKSSPISNVWLVLAFLICPYLYSWLDASVLRMQQQGLDMLVSPLAERISQSGNRKVVVMPLADAKDNVNALGAHLSRQISERLNKLFPEIEIIDPETLHVPAQSDSNLEVSESDIEKLKSLAWSAGAEICILGDFAPFKVEMGISLHAWKSDQSLLADSYGSIPLTPQMLDLSPKPLTYTLPMDGIFAGGFGGVSLPKPLNPSIANSTGENGDLHGAGLVSMNLVVGANGTVQQVVILESSSASLSSRVVKIFSSLRYVPAKTPDGTAVAARFHLTFAVVEVELTVAADGRVRQARVLESPNQDFSDKAIQGVKNWKLKPAIGPGGQPVVAKVQTEITFTLYSK